MSDNSERCRIFWQTVLKLLSRLCRSSWVLEQGFPRPGYSGLQEDSGFLHCVPEYLPFNLLNNSVKNETILIKFDTESRRNSAQVIMRANIRLTQNITHSSRADSMPSTAALCHGLCKAFTGFF